MRWDDRAKAKYKALEEQEKKALAESKKALQKALDALSELSQCRHNSPATDEAIKKIKEAGFWINANLQ